MKHGSRMTAILVHIPKARVKQLDELVKSKEFANRNEAIREAVRSLINEAELLNVKET